MIDLHQYWWNWPPDGVVVTRLEKWESQAVLCRCMTCQLGTGSAAQVWPEYKKQRQTGQADRGWDRMWQVERQKNRNQRCHGPGHTGHRWWADRHGRSGLGDNRNRHIVRLKWVLILLVSDYKWLYWCINLRKTSQYFILLFRIIKMWRRKVKTLEGFLQGTSWNQNEIQEVQRDPGPGPVGWDVLLHVPGHWQLSTWSLWGWWG